MQSQYTKRKMTVMLKPHMGRKKKFEIHSNFSCISVPLTMRMSDCHKTFCLGDPAHVGVLTKHKCCECYSLPSIKQKGREKGMEVAQAAFVPQLKYSLL